MTLSRRFFADESGLSRLTWVILIALAASLAVYYRAQLGGVVDWLRSIGGRLAGGAFW